MLERLSIPRRPFDFEDYIDILRRNIRWILAPAFFGLIVSTMVAYLMEDTFVSVARIRIVPQQVPENLVQSTNSQTLSDHINGMAETIKSRATLTSLITTFGLYKKELKRETIDDVISIMGPAIKITPTAGVTNVSDRNLPAIQISFAYRERYTAQKVCQDIVSRFMNENERDRMGNVVATDQFLKDEFERAKRDLDNDDQKLTEFRTKYAGKLPEEVSMNLSEMNALQSRLQSLNDAASRNDEQRLMLESELRINKDRLSSLKDTAPQVQARNERITDLDHQIATLETTIENMRDRYTDDFPDLQQARQQLAVLKRQRDDLSKQDKPSAAPKSAPAIENPGVSRERMDNQATGEQLKTALQANKMEAHQIAKEIDDVNVEVKQYQNRMISVPAGETEESELIRDRDLAKAKYQDLELKLQRSSISMDMESRKQGESLEVLDQASLPETPTKPKRSMIIPAGAVLGLLVGIVLIAIREVKDTSLKNLKDARLYTQLSILGSIPLLENDLVVQRRKQIMWVGWATATLVGLAVMAGSVVHYYMNKV
ncbi:MAG TPA: GNVR domain-containing protein [Bryobacteraceae bacterium]|nr:GNVR domain-containing protein [Bryobacteraceae bacterium]